MMMRRIGVAAIALLALVPGLTVAAPTAGAAETTTKPPQVAVAATCSTTGPPAGYYAQEQWINDPFGCAKCVDRKRVWEQDNRYRGYCWQVPGYNLVTLYILCLVCRDSDPALAVRP
jgi:hypothetical protein